MYLNAIIFSKLQKLYRQIADDNEYYLTFAPIPTCFSNSDFNFLNPNASSADQVRENAENKMAFAHIANTIARSEKLFELNNDEMLGDAYEKIINRAKLIDTTVSAGDQQIFSAAKALLFDDNLMPTALHTKYKEYAVRYQGVKNKILELTIKVNESRAEDQPQILQQKQELELQGSLILNDWLINGDKDRIEKLLQVVYGSNEKAAFVTEFNNERQNLATLARENTVNSYTEYLPAFCLPNDIYKYNYNGWRKITMDKEEIESTEKDARVFLGNDLYNAYASGSSANKIEFEYLFVTIQRNWFKKNLINSRFWNFGPSEGTVVSDGSDLAKGMLPAFAEKFLFIRRVMHYMAVDEHETVREVQPNTLPAFRFADIAKLKKFSMVRTVQPKETSVSKMRFVTKDTFRIKLKKTPPAGIHAPAPGKIIGRQPRTSILLKTRGITSATPRTDGGASSLHTITFLVKDTLNNPVLSLEASLINMTTGEQDVTATDNTGKLRFPEITRGKYRLQISGNELYEDFENTYEISASLTASIILQKRADPQFDMWLLGAVNYRFPKLPNPLSNYTYT